MTPRISGWGIADLMWRLWSYKAFSFLLFFWAVYIWISRAYTCSNELNLIRWEWWSHLKQLSSLLEIILTLLSLATLPQLLQNPGQPVELLPGMIIKLIETEKYWLATCQSKVCRVWSSSWTKASRSWRPSKRPASFHRSSAAAPSVRCKMNWDRNGNLQKIGLTCLEVEM